MAGVANAVTEQLDTLATLPVAFNDALGAPQSPALLQPLHSRNTPADVF